MNTASSTATATDVSAPMSEPTATVRTVPLLLTVTEAARYMGVSRSTMYALVNRRTIASVALPGVQHQYVRRVDVDGYVAGLMPVAA